jgi:hypothetical protein
MGLAENDFEQMGWHDCWVHALAFDPEAAELLFDLDYILQWINPGPEEKHFSFWSAPATLVFSEVENLKVSLEPFPAFELDAISREKPGNAEAAGNHLTSAAWLWTLDFFNGRITFHSTGFRQYIRKPPILNTTQSLALDQRGGRSFDRCEGCSTDHEPTL